MFTVIIATAWLIGVSAVALALSPERHRSQGRPIANASLQEPLESAYNESKIGKEAYITFG